MTSIEIKEVTIKEQALTIDLLMSGLQQSEQEYFEKSAPWSEIKREYLQHLISMQETCDGTCLVAYNGAIAIGFIFGYIEEPDESRIEIYTGKELYVSDGYVQPEYRKQGIYKKMNQLLEQKYIDRGVRRITRFTLANNEPMKSLLTQSGYKATRILFEKWL
ncbi:MAG: GNAT family N-acetyltransferase [Bacteroidota bacterium]|nr:GNAT family N-acetyltransferase [Bacteroidota bacterium]